MYETDPCTSNILSEISVFWVNSTAAAAAAFAKFKLPVQELSKQG
jgi:hypothetical protein